MLAPAIEYQEEIIKKMRQTWFKERYKYFYAANYYDDWQIENSTWNAHQFASVREREVIGYVGYRIDRGSGDVAYCLAIVNFEVQPSMTWSMDLGRALRDIFERYNLRKLRFSVVVGNPIEKSYDKLCLKYGGRIVGIETENVRLIDGLFYDEKFYEILRRDYIAAREEHEHGKADGS